jgi:tetratricopeptide (TPR) repeat protein
MTKLESFLGRDSRARDNAVRLAALIGFFWFLVGGPLFHLTDPQAAYSAFGVMGAIYSMQVVAYCRKPIRLNVGFTQAMFSVRRMAMAALTIGVIIFVQSCPAPQLQAKILDGRFDRLTSRGTLSPEQAKALSFNLAVAKDNAINVTDTTQLKIYKVVKSAALEHPDSPAIVGAARDLIDYSRELHPEVSPSSIQSNGAPAEAVDSLRQGGRLSLHVTTEFQKGNISNDSLQEARLAVSFFTRAIDLANSNPEVLSLAYLGRAVLYLDLKMPTEAIADIRSFEALPGADLADVLAIESDALLVRGSREDIERAIALLNVATKLPAPNLPFANKALGELPRIDAVGNLAQSYYRLRDFNRCIEYTRQLLDMARGQGVVSIYARKAYIQIIAAYLHLGNKEMATRAAQEWAETTPEDLFASTTLHQLQSKDFDSQLWLRSTADGGLVFR